MKNAKDNKTDKPTADELKKVNEWLDDEIELIKDSIGAIRGVPMDILLTIKAILERTTR